MWYFIKKLTSVLHVDADVSDRRVTSYNDKAVCQYLVYVDCYDASSA